MKSIKVHVGYYKHRHQWMMYYQDPKKEERKRVFKTPLINGKTIDGRPAKAPKTSTKYKPTEASKKEALKLAAQWEKELNEAINLPTNVTWKKFRELYENEVLTGLASGTDRKVATVFNSIESILAPEFLYEITAEKISKYTCTLRKTGTKGKPEFALSENTIAGNLAHLKAALNWAVEYGLITSAPKIKRPKRAEKKGKNKPMKGRAPTQEEFERMLACVPKIVDAIAAPSWKHFLEGLWWSGLRLAESLELYWNEDGKHDQKLYPILNGKQSLLHIPAHLEKGNETRRIPLAPEFVQFLEKTPAADRKGPVFRPKPIKSDGPGRKPKRVGVDRASHVVSLIGKKANVVVHRNDSGTKIKYASAHDLRRSFGTRWSKRLMPAQLKELMRHASIDTTMDYYVQEQSSAAAKSLWDAYDQHVPNANPNAKHASTPTDETTHRNPQ